MITLKTGLFADYIGFMQGTKPLLVGVFDNMFTRPAEPGGPMQLPLSFLLLFLEAGVVDGSTHRMALKLRDEDHNPIADLWEQQVTFHLTAPGRPLQARVLTQLVGIKVPRYCDYDFVVEVDGTEVGSVPIAVMPPPESADTPDSAPGSSGPA